MTRAGALPSLALVAVLALASGCGQANYPEQAQAVAFADKVTTDQLSEATAANVPPLTPEAKRYPQVDPATRVASAHLYGPIETLQSTTCVLPHEDTTSHCDGALFICTVDGLARGGTISAKVGVCHSDTGGWELAAIAMSYPSDQHPN